MLAAQQSLQAALERETVLQTKLDHFVVGTKTQPAVRKRKLRKAASGAPRFRCQIRGKSWMTRLSGWPKGAALAKFGFDCSPQQASRRSPRPFDRLAWSIVSKGDMVRRHDGVNWLDDTVNWVATSGDTKYQHQKNDLT